MTRVHHDFDYIPPGVHLGWFGQYMCRSECILPFSPGLIFEPILRAHSNERPIFTVLPAFSLVSNG